MKALKKTAAALLSLTLVMGAVGCGSGDGEGQSKSANESLENTGVELNEEQVEQVQTLEDKLEDFELENKTIRWLAHYDINPTNGAVKDPAIELFETKYGGKIEWITTTWDARYTDLAKLVMADDSPDFFPCQDMAAFPKGPIKGMIDPIDGVDHLDLDSELWADTVNAMNMYTYNGDRYMCTIYICPTYVCVYNRTTMEENGFEDPAELYYKNEWDWDIFKQMMMEFTDQEKDKAGLDGYWYVHAISQTCGVPLIDWEDGQVVSRLRDPRVEKVQNFMYDLGKNNLVYDRSKNNWSTRGDGTTGLGLGSYETLFIPVGPWGIEGPLSQTKPFGDMEAGEIMFVPMPRDPDSDTYYMSSELEGYVLCKNAPNKDGFAAFMNCSKLCQSEAENIKIDTLMNEYKWSREMIDMRSECLDLCKKNPVFDISAGVSPELDAIMIDVSQATMYTGGKLMSWTQCVEDYSPAIDYLIKEVNAQIAATE